MTATDAKASRNVAIRATARRIRVIEAKAGVSRGTFAAIRKDLPARHGRLFPSREFRPPPDGGEACRCLLHGDPGDRPALYINAPNPRNGTRPRDRSTWAAVVAVEGQEPGRVYGRLDDGRGPGRCEVALAEVMVEPRRGIHLVPGDIHSIHTTGDRPRRRLDMDGLAPGRLDGRRAHDMESGQVFPCDRSVMMPTAAAAG